MERLKSNIDYNSNEMSGFYMVLPWQYERVYGCNIIFETHKNNIEKIYAPKYQVMNFIYFVYGAWVWMGASADLITLEGEYITWVVFRHLLTPLPCILNPLGQLLVKCCYNARLWMCSMYSIQGAYL